MRSLLKKQKGISKSMHENKKITIANDTDEHYTLPQLLTVKSGILSRILLGLIIPIVLIGVISVNIPALKYLFNHINEYSLLIGLIIIGILLTSPWTIGTGLFGHILLPYYSFLITGTPGYYTYKNDHSILKLNHQIYMKYNKQWISMTTYALKIIKDNDYEIEN